MLTFTSQTKKGIKTFLLITFILCSLIIGVVISPEKTHAVTNEGIEQQVNIIEGGTTIGGTKKGIAYVDPANYTGATFYFEVVALVTSGTGSIDLKYGAGTGSTPSGGSTLTISNINTTSYARYRSASFSLTAGNAYINNPTGTGTDIRVARIIIVESNLGTINNTETQITIGAYNSTSTASTTDVPLQRAKYWTYDGTKYDGTVTVYFEAAIYDDTAGQIATASLYPAGASCSGQVSGSSVTVTGTTVQRVRSNAITLTNGTTYMVCYNTTSGGNALVANARLIIDQTSSGGLTKMELQHVSMSTQQTNATSTYTLQNYLFQYDPASWAGGTFTYYFESTLKTSAGTAYSQLYNNTDASAISSSEVTTTNTTGALVRSSSITMPSTAKDMDTQIKNSATNTTTVEGSWLIIDVTGLPLNTTPQTFNAHMSNTLYSLYMGNLNAFAGNATGPNYKVKDTGGQLGPGLYSGSGKKIRSGFEYIKSIIPFTFSISNTNINFGTLSPTNPITRTNLLTIANNSAYGYIVTVAENHQLMIPGKGAIIPNTTCDSGTCSPTTSAAWTNTLTFGFGYRCDNITATDCASGFTTSTFYKQFPDASTATAAQTVMSGTNATKKSQGQITYKINISGSQTAGLYTNVITYIATPTF